MTEEKSDIVVVVDNEGTQVAAGKQSGMHPGVIGGRRLFAKVNTSKPYKGGGKLAKHQKKLNDRRNAHSQTLKSLPGNVNPASYKTPGSMNQHASS